VPYKITPAGHSLVANRTERYLSSKDAWDFLTDWQKEVLKYLDGRKDDDYIPAHDIGYDLKEHPRAISGIAYSLIRKGLVEKKPGE
jgi:DNA-binding MarR family transcriptional regulator